MKDVSFGQYYPVSSFVHRMDPRVKILLSIAYIVAVFLIREFHFFGFLAAFLFILIAAFAALVFTLLTIIGINSYVIRQKTMRLNQLEQRKERLVEQRSELEKDILEAQSYEKILEFVREHGMILDPNP